MLIRYGYEITLICAQPTALVCLLSVHDDHAKSIRVPERVFTTPIIPMKTYRDLFGNQCRRLVAPSGDLTLWGDATIEDSGQPEAAVPDAREVPAADLPDECLVYLMGSRYCETDRLTHHPRDRPRRRARLAKVDPDLAIQPWTRDFWFHHIPALSRIFLHRARISNPRSGQ
jgi:hypothetical protein